jgi:hypothetical protein
MLNEVWLTEGQLKAMTMMFDDLFKGKSALEMKMCCLHSIPGAWFERSLCELNLRRKEYCSIEAALRPDAPAQ